jgi:hypothetical protein
MPNQTFSCLMLRYSATESDFIFRDLGQVWTNRYDYFSDPSHLNRYGAYQVSLRLAQDPMIPWPRALDLSAANPETSDAMTLPSILYGLFLLSVVGLYWALQQRSLRTWLLLIASIVFYTSLQVHYVPLMFVPLWRLTFGSGGYCKCPADWRVSNEQWQMAEQQMVSAAALLASVWGGPQCAVYCCSSNMWKPGCNGWCPTWFEILKWQMVAGSRSLFPWG